MAEPLEHLKIVSERFILSLMQAASAAGLPWELPRRTANCDIEPTEIGIDWWKGPRNLTIFFKRDKIEANRVWGFSINQQLEKHVLTDTEGFLKLYKWLLTGEWI